MSGIPFATFKVHTVDVTSVSRFLSNILVGLVIVDLIPECQSINSDYVLSSVVLECTCQESLGEEESGDPEDLGCAIVNPVGQEVNTIVAILDP